MSLLLVTAMSLLPLIPIALISPPACFAGMCLIILTNAALRNVQIKLITTACSDSRLVAAAASSYYDELLRAGALIFEYGPPMLHAKTLLVDGHYAMIGSANFDNRSFRLNFEVATVILSAAFNAELAALFERDLSRCRRITERRRLPWRQRLLEAVARLFSRRMRYQFEMVFITIT